MLILFAKNLVLQSEWDDMLRDPFREKPVHETSVIQTRSSEDRISTLNRNMSEQGDLISRTT